TRGPCSVRHGAQYQRYRSSGSGARDALGRIGSRFRGQVLETRRIIAGKTVPGPRLRRVPARLARGLCAGDTAQAQGIPNPLARGLRLGDRMEKGGMNYLNVYPKPVVREMSAHGRAGQGEGTAA